MAGEPTKRMLIVDDDAFDIEFFKRAARSIPELEIVSTDDQTQTERLARETRPGLILIDLRMPGRDGDEVVSSLRADDSLVTTPIIIVSSSSHPEDIKRCYRSGANCYCTKPASMEAYRRLLGSVVDFWFDVAEGPH